LKSMSGRSWKQRSKPTPGTGAADAGWTHCLYCGYPLTSPVSRVDGFGASCYVKLDRAERERIRAAAERVRQVEGCSHSGRSVGPWRTWWLIFMAERGWRRRH
jgi:hypothetical protein